MAVIEKLLPPNYYSVDLAGVQADQVRDHTHQPHPRLSWCTCIIESDERSNGGEVATAQ